MTARAPSMPEIVQRLRAVEQDAADVRTHMINVGTTLDSNTKSIKALNEDFGSFLGEWRTSGLSSFAEDWKAFRAEQAADKAARDAKSERDTQENLAQDARLARLEQAGAQIQDGAERAENAAPAIVGAFNRLEKIAVPPKGASARSWAIFALTVGLTVWEVLRAAGVIK